MLLYYSAGTPILTFIIIHLEPGCIRAYLLGMSVLVSLSSMSPKHRGSGTKATLEPESGSPHKHLLCARHCAAGLEGSWGEKDLVIAYRPLKLSTLQRQGVFVLIIASSEADIDLNLKQPTQITQSYRSFKTFIFTSISSTKSHMFSLNSHNNSEIVIINPILR